MKKLLVLVFPGINFLSQFTSKPAFTDIFGFSFLALYGNCHFKEIVFNYGNWHFTEIVFNFMSHTIPCFFLFCLLIRVIIAGFAVKTFMHSKVYCAVKMYKNLHLFQNETRWVSELIGG